MEILFAFLLKASLGIILFYLVYWLFLRNETFYKANRWFLLLALVTSVLIPVFPVKYAVIYETENVTGAFKAMTDAFRNAETVSVSETQGTAGFSWEYGITFIYLTGASIFLLRLLSQTFILIHIIVKYRIKSLDGIRIVENEKYGLPFSFFNVVFINPKFHKQENLPEILAHEKVHIRENHWFDLLFIELLTVIFWFNPFIWFFERSMKQNHEYLADKGVISTGHSVARYQALLLNQLMGMQIIGVTNNLNFALNTNRLKMMTKKKTPKIKWARFTWALPVLAVLLFAFAEPNYQSIQTSLVSSNNSAGELIFENTIKFVGTVVDENGEPLPGAAVVIQDSWVGTFCDMDGKFKLEVPENAAIIISFVGKKYIADTFAEIKSGYRDGEVYSRKYTMEDAALWLFNKNYTGEQLPPPPPLPPPPGAGEKEVSYIDWPKYPGGFEAMQEYIEKMQQKIAQSKGVKGKALISFTLDKKGKVTDIKVVEKDNDAAAKRAVMIASEMPEWTPAKQHGKPVPVKYLLPVEFK